MGHGDPCAGTEGGTGGDEDGPRALLRQVAVAGAHGPGQGAHHGTLPRRGEAYAGHVFHHVGEVAAEVVALLHLGTGVDLLDAALVVVLVGIAQELAHLFAEGLIVGVAEADDGVDAGELGEGAPADDLALFVHVDEAALAQQHVGPGHLGVVHLAVVADQNEVGVVVDPGLGHGVHDLAQPVVQHVQRTVHLRAEDAEVVAGGVHHAVVHQQHVRLMAADQGADAAVHEVLVGVVVLHPLAGADVVGGQAVCVLPHHFDGVVVGAEAAEGLLHILVVGEEILVDEVVDVGVVAGDGPVDGGGGLAGTLGGGEQVLHLHLGGGGQVVGDAVIPRQELLVGDDAVLVGVAAGEHGGVAGVGEAGVDALHPLHLCGLCHQACEVGFLLQIGDILPHQCVGGKNDHFAAHNVTLL